MCVRGITTTPCCTPTRRGRWIKAKPRGIRYRATTRSAVTVRDRLWTAIATRSGRPWRQRRGATIPMWARGRGHRATTVGGVSETIVTVVPGSVLDGAAGGGAVTGGDGQTTATSAEL